VKGLVAKSIDAGIARLGFNRQRRGARVPFRSLWSRSFDRGNRTPDQRDAFSIAACPSRADRNGSLTAFLKPNPGLGASRPEPGTPADPCPISKVLIFETVEKRGIYPLPYPMPGPQ
jgi:hypothetical protein